MSYLQNKSDTQILAEAGIDIDTLISAAADFIRAQSEIRSQVPQTVLSEEEQQILYSGGVPDSAFFNSNQHQNSSLVAEYGSLVARALTPTQIAEYLEIGLEEVLQRIERKSLYAIHTAKGWVCPLWQFHNRATLPGLQLLLSVLSPSVHPVGVQRFFCSPNIDLEVDTGGIVTQLTPYEWLISGRPINDVLVLARDI